MKVCFLDIDGVVNSKNWHIKRSESGNKESYCDMAPHHIKQLNRIVDAHPDVRFVISSTWRHHISDSLTWMMIFELLHCKAHVIDVTPSLSTYRGTEILCWLFTYMSKRTKNPNWYDRGIVESFIILDDDNDMEMLAPRLCLCKNEDGLTKEVADQAIKMLHEPVNLNLMLEIGNA